MADAKGSSSAGGGVGRGEFVGAGRQDYQGLLASMGPPPTGAPNVYNHQYPAGLIHPPLAMTVRAPPPHLRLPTHQAPPHVPPPPHFVQPNVPPGYLYFPPHPNDIVAQQVPRGSADWPMHNPALVSLVHGNNLNNGYPLGFEPCSTAAWPNYMPNSYNNFAPAIEDHRSQFYHGNNHEKGSGFATSFRVDPPLVPAPTFPQMPSASESHSSVKILNETDAPDMESENSDELDLAPVVELPGVNQSHESLTARFNCRGYRIIVRKDLTNSDVGTIGRIVVPKRDAEANLPALLERDGIVLKMDDFKLPATWNFKYRFWPNNKSRMYILENTGEFVKSHGLQAGDILIIYKDPESGNLLVRGEKATEQNAPLLCVECKEEGNNSEDCGFAMCLQSKRT